MSNISIGGITLRHNPTKMTPVRPDKTYASQKTHGGVAFWDWGTAIVGKEIQLDFTRMESDEFDDYDDLYKACAPVVFDPQNGSGKTYNAQMKFFDCDYFRTLDVSAGHFRDNVKMILLIMSEV